MNRYDHEPWAQLARRAGFDPINTESSAREAFRFCADLIPAPVEDHWAEAPGFPVAQWQYEVAEDDTRLGYWQWVEAKGPLCIEVFPMNGETIADRRDEVTHWDVLVRPDGGDPIEEHEGLTLETVEEVCTKMEAKYPGVTADWQLQDLLR